MSEMERWVIVHVAGQGGLACRVEPGLTPPPVEGEAVIVEVDGGLDNGTISNPDAAPGTLKCARWCRRATAADLSRIEANRAAAKIDLKRITEKVRANGIVFKPLDAHYSLGHDRLALLFGCDENIEMRNLLAIMPADIKARIELRQISPRDECARLGGIGPCGRAYCCCTWQKYFGPVNVRMAKVQDLSLAPASINGGCDRLKCCLRFEYDQYRDAGEMLPFYGTLVEGDGVRGVVVGRQLLRAILTVRTDDGKYVSIPASDVRIVRHAPPPGGNGPGSDPSAGRWGREQEGEAGNDDHTNRERAEPGPAGNA